MNRVRFLTSGAFFLFAVGCLIWAPDLPFQMPVWVYGVATAYFAVFPLKDMCALTSYSLYKSRQFAKSFQPRQALDAQAFDKMKRMYNRRAVGAMVFWLGFMLVVGILYWTQVIGRAWVFFFFALSNFCIYFAVFFWCPFHKIFIRPCCCMECRIYNWDSFFAYSFLILIPSVYSVVLFSLGLLSLLEWELMHALHPERFYKISNQHLSCDNCDLEACKQGKKKRFHTKLRVCKAKPDFNWKEESYPCNR